MLNIIKYLLLTFKASKMFLTYFQPYLLFYLWYMYIDNCYNDIASVRLVQHVRLYFQSLIDAKIIKRCLLIFVIYRIILW